MTNLERARNGERLKVKKSGDYIIRGIDGEDFLVNPNYVDDLINWINQQIDYAVTHDTVEGNIMTDKSKSLTLRDQIALSVLPKVELEDTGTIGDAAKELGIKTEEYSYKIHWPILSARKCYVYADAFLKERDANQSKIDDETEEPELWRDLEEGEVYQEGDRIAIHKYDWKIITKDHRFINQSRAITEPLAQRRVRKEEL